MGAQTLVMDILDLLNYCERGPCCLRGGHDGPCEPGSYGAK